MWLRTVTSVAGVGRARIRARRLIRWLAVVMLESVEDVRRSDERWEEPHIGVSEELLRHVVRTTGLPPALARRVVSDVMGYFVETAEEYVLRRHAELRRDGLANAKIWSLLRKELDVRPVAAPPLSERQLRRIVYG